MESTETTYEKGNLYQLETKSIAPDENQPRKFFDDAAMEEMKNSIKKHGVLQPVLFNTTEDGGLVLVSGERRWRACSELKVKEIPGIFVGGENVAEIALVENLLREDLNPIDEAEALKRLKEDHSYSDKDLSAMIGKAPSTISEILSLDKLPKSVKDKARQNAKISRRALVEVAKADSPRSMGRLYAKHEKGLSGEAMRAQTRRARSVDATLLTMSKGLHKKLDEVKLDDIEDNKKNDVKVALEELLQLISGKISELE